MTAEPGQRPPAVVRPRLRLRRTQRPGAHRPRGAAGRLARARRPRGRHRPALDAAVRAGQERPGRRCPHRRGAGPRQHDLRQGARRGRPHPDARPPRPRPRRGSWRWSATTSRTRPSAASCWPSRPTARTRCSRRTSRSTSPPPTRCGRRRAPSAPRPRWSTSSPSSWPARSSSTGSTPGWRAHRPTRLPSATSARVATTSPARCGARRRTPRAELSVADRQLGSSRRPSRSSPVRIVSITIVERSGATSRLFQATSLTSSSTALQPAPSRPARRGPARGPGTGRRR